MDAKTGFFYFFSAVLLYAALRVITARNPVHAVLHLILGFSQAAAIWLLLKAEFLGIMLVVVYMGAVMVLFLFVVMMLDIRIDRMREGFWKHFPVAAAIGALVALEMAVVLMGGFGTLDEAKPVADLLNAQGQVLPYSNTQALGRLMYTEYLFPIEVAAVILLVAMIAAIALTLRKRKDAKTPDITGQAAGTCPGPFDLGAHAGNPGCGDARTRGGDQMTLTLGHFLTLGAMLFAISVIGIFLNRKNLIVLLMAIEMMLLSVNMNFVAFSHYLGDMHGQLFVFFILTVAAAEAAIGLAILVLLFRNKSNINAEDLNILKG